MLKKYIAILVIALGVAPLFADVELQTSINDVYYRGSAELAGSITMTINDDDFTNASTSEPVYIRVKPDHRSKLAETLVEDDDDIDPIFLAMELVGADSGGGFYIASAPETVSIVRWVQGESEFWVRVQTDSDLWIGSPSGPKGPNEELKVSWTLGISARSSARANDTWFDGPLLRESNLPFNTREPLTAGLDEDATSTLVCVDLRQSNLTTDGVESRLQIDIIAFDDDADIGGGNYSGTAGNDTGINFTNDFNIARGRNRFCELDLSPFKDQDAASELLCVPAAAGNDNQTGLVSMTNVFRFVITCFDFKEDTDGESFGDLLDSDLFDESTLTFTTNSGSYGFAGMGDAEFGEVDGNGVFSGLGAGNGSVDLSGYSAATDLYSTLALNWNAGTQELDHNDPFAVAASVTVWAQWDSSATNVDLTWNMTLATHDGAEDIAPFDGDDQLRRCPASRYDLGGGTWDFGDFVPCQGATVALFFPYVPKFAGDTGFWVGLSYVNQGTVDFADDGIAAIFYNENGDRFSALMPGLPVRNQMTWVLSADGLTGAGDNNFGDTRVPLATDPSVPDDSFGDTRMSMFLTGDFEAEFKDDVNDGDLDGYMLIGNSNTNSVDGAYLPRNYDNSLEKQNADLPIERSKRRR